MSAYDYWDELAEAESVGEPAPPPVVHKTVVDQELRERLGVTKPRLKCLIRESRKRRGLE